jgi:hypothetical protein
MITITDIITITTTAIIIAIITIAIITIAIITISPSAIAHTNAQYPREASTSFLWKI